MTTRSLHLVNELKELDRLRSFLADSAGAYSLDDRTLYRLNLICDELVTNIVSYGYGEGEKGTRRIEVSLTGRPDGVEIRIADDGVPFDPLSRPAPDLSADVDERGIGGLGIHFAKTLTDAALYTREGERNVLRLTIKRLMPDEERTG
ncbi:ATP-binding protein [Paenibacillus flagellatus]|uniref:ATP-binding protein n=1 Tax=Paenibacillus flagellatus TaxID=2211139 RepID=UPI0013051D5C|nr:ATP-binding protein [Paenibacillus flagellatus]